MSRPLVSLCAKRINGGVPHGIVANVLDFDFIVNLFELQSRYYIHF